MKENGLGFQKWKRFQAFKLSKAVKAAESGFVILLISNLPSCPRIIPVPVIPSSAMGFYAFNAQSFLPFFWSRFVQCTMAKHTEFVCLILGVCGFFADTYAKVNPISVSSPSDFFLLECLLVILMNYKQCNKMYICPGRHPTTPRSTIRDHVYFSAGPTHRVFHQVQHTEFPHLDRRKVNPLPCMFQTFLPLIEEFLPSQTTSHR